MPPRLDQIAELTRGTDLPLPPLHREHLRFIVEVVCTAWAVLRERHSHVLLRRDEAEITSLLESRLLAFLDEEPLWAQMVRAVARGRETVSFDGSHLEKRPDLSLFLTCRTAIFPLAIESKIIDEANGKTAKLYCDQGISRFLRGEYAWATREAIMIAYVRDKSTTISSLAPLLMPSGAGAAPYRTNGPVTPMGIPPPDLVTSSHSRIFRYPLRPPPGNVPSVIALWHLWLAVSEISEPACLRDGV
jgi:hypothetical protein